MVEVGSEREAVAEKDEIYNAKVNKMYRLMSDCSDRNLYGLRSNAKLIFKMSKERTVLENVARAVLMRRAHARATQQKLMTEGDLSDGAFKLRWMEHGRSVNDDAVLSKDWQTAQKHMELREFYMDYSSAASLARERGGERKELTKKNIAVMNEHKPARYLVARAWELCGDEPSFGEGQGQKAEWITWTFTMRREAVKTAASLTRAEIHRVSKLCNGRFGVYSWDLACTVRILLDSLDDATLTDLKMPVVSLPWHLIVPCNCCCFESDEENLLHVGEASIREMLRDHLHRMPQRVQQRFRARSEE